MAVCQQLVPLTLEWHAHDQNSQGLNPPLVVIRAEVGQVAGEVVEQVAPWPLSDRVRVMQSQLLVVRPVEEKVASSTHEILAPRAVNGEEALRTQEVRIWDLRG